MSLIRNKIILTLFLLFSLALFSQETASFQLPYTEGMKIDLNLDECFIIKITADKAIDYIEVKSKSEGVYENQMRLDYEQNEEELRLFTTFPQLLSSGFDKLSSHKVLVFEVEIKVPENTQLYLESNVGFVEVSGKFYSFTADLKYGDIDLKPFTGKAKISTYRGHINLSTQDAKVEAISRKGEVEVDDFYYPKNLIQLQSIEGDIKVVSFN